MNSASAPSKLGTAVSQETFALAQQAELEKWQEAAADEAAIRHELTEEAGVAAPLRAATGDRDFTRALEVGIGAFSLGFLAVHFADRVGPIDGLDPLPRLDLDIRDAALREHVEAIRGRVNYIQSPAESMPLPDGAYDLVSCINVVDHARDPQKILAEISRVLKPGGTLVFAVSTLSKVGELKWHIGRRRRPHDWFFVAHPHTFQWHAANQLVETVPGRTLWYDQPGWVARWVGHGRMSFWIRIKDEER
jgi:ubiquinone/menaquinone biosynthesis C-methylase UbiE